MKKIKPFLKKHWAHLLLGAMILLYIGYFSYFTILRFQTLYASYFDLGIMHQTVYNTFQAIKHGNWGRFLELTNPYGPEQIKRMAIHNDILLAFMAPFYFIYAGAETLLVIQAVVLGFGALAVFKIAAYLFQKVKTKNLLSLAFVFAYLMYTPMQRANIFEFHAVALATTFLLFMFYFALVKRYRLSFIFLLLSLFSKEEVGLTTSFYGFYILYEWHRGGRKGRPVFPIVVVAASLLWFLTSMFVIIPFFRGGNHFALNYYADFGDSPLRVILGVIDNPQSLMKYLWNIDTLRYFFFLLGPVAFLSVFSSLHLLIAAPEFGINLLSNNWNMRNIIYHYTSVIQPFVFISALYGAHHLMQSKKIPWARRMPVIVPVVLIIATCLFSYFKGPLPFSREKEIYPFLYPQKYRSVAAFWKDLLKNKRWRVSTTGHMAPFFSDRRYYYIFSKNYPLADFIVLDLEEVYNYPDKETLIPVYERLTKDVRFRLVYKNENLEVYRKMTK